MTNIKLEKARRFNYIYSIILSICIVIAGLCLIFACIGIYHSGKQPFSREAVADAFSDIAIPIYLCLILTIIGILIDIFFSTTKDKIKNNPDYEYLLENMHDKRDMNKCDASLVAKIGDIRRKRKLIRNTNIIITSLCSIAFLIYALNSNHFHQSNINGSMVKAMYVLIPCLLISFGYTLFYLHYNQNSIKAELELLKLAPIKNSTLAKDATNTSNNVASIIRYILLVTGIVLLIYGFITGGTADVLTKAVNICTECIGLG